MTRPRGWITYGESVLRMVLLWTCTSTVQLAIGGGLGARNSLERLARAERLPSGGEDRGTVVQRPRPSRDRGGVKLPNPSLNPWGRLWADG